MTPPARYLAPGWFTRHAFNPVVALLTRCGLPSAGSAILEVRGRISGQMRATPVNPLVLDGATYLIAPRGVTHWVRNIRAAGRATLRQGRTHRHIRVTELADADKATVLAAYRAKWGWEVGKFFGDGPINPADFPVFRVD